jgi:hypothetical protein
MIDPAIAEIGTDAEGAPHRAAMHARKRHRRARSADDGVGLGDGGRDTIKSEGQRSEEQRRSDEGLFHDFLLHHCDFDPLIHSTAMSSGKLSSRGIAYST